MFLSPDTKVYIQYYRKADSTARDFRLEKFENGQLKHLLKAQTAEWKGPPDKWQLNNYEKRSFNGMQEVPDFGTWPKTGYQFGAHSTGFCGL